MKTLDDAPLVNLFSEEFQEDPYSVIWGLREESSVLRTPIGGMIVGRDLVQSLLADRRLRSSLADFVRMQGVEGGIIAEMVDSSLLANDGQEHLRLRKLVNRAFTPRSIDPHRPAMRTIMGSLLDNLAGQDSFDFVSEIADHYPIWVMCQLLGVPEEDRADFATWNKAITWVLSLQLNMNMDLAVWGATQLDNYVGRLVEERRAEPREDMVTALVQAEEEGDRLSDMELRSMISSLLFAGFDTTRNQLGLAMALFADHADQWHLLAEQPELAPQAVEEVMRYWGAVSIAPRTVAEPLEVAGYHIPAGTLLTLSTGSANHDPEVYDDPMTFDITVKDREPQLTFGGGPHYCLGANLARAEMQEALPLLAQHLPDFALDGEGTWRSTLSSIYGPESLPVSVPSGVSQVANMRT